MKEKRTLFLFTQNYPFGNAEVFVHNEVLYLAQTFNLIIICGNTDSMLVFNVPNNVTVVRKKFTLTTVQKIWSIVSVFNLDIIKELLFKTRFKVRRINYLLQSWTKSKKISQFIEKQIKARGLDKRQVILYSYWWLDEAIGIAQFKKKEKEVIAISRTHGYDLYYYRSKLNYLPLKTFCAAYLNRIYCISNDGVLYANNILGVYNVDLQRLGTIASNIKNPHKPNQKLRIVSCSSIYPNKNIDKISEVIKLLTTINVEWTHFGGRVNPCFESYYQSVLKKMKELDTSNNCVVRFMGAVNNKEILNFYEKEPVDLFINLSSSEGIPVSIMEAMSYGIPCLATGVGGTPEIVDNENGFLIESDLIEEDIAQIILDYYFQETSLKNLKRDRAYSKWNECFNASINYPKLIDSLVKLK